MIIKRNLTNFTIREVLNKCYSIKIFNYYPLTDTAAFFTFNSESTRNASSI